MQTPEKKRNRGKYDPQLKLTIAREYLTTDLGYGSLSKKYNIPNSSIYDIVKWYKKKYGDGFVEPAVVESTNQSDIKDLMRVNFWKVSELSKSCHLKK